MQAFRHAGIQVWKYAGMRVRQVRQVCNHASMASMQKCKYASKASMQVCKYASKASMQACQACRHAGMQVKQVCKHAGMQVRQVCNHAGMQPCGTSLVRRDAASLTYLPTYLLTNFLLAFLPYLLAYFVGPPSCSSTLLKRCNGGQVDAPPPRGELTVGPAQWPVSE